MENGRKNLAAMFLEHVLTVMKVIIITTRNMDGVTLSGSQGISIEEDTVEMKERVSVRCAGQMGQSIEETGSRESSMESES